MKNGVALRLPEGISTEEFAAEISGRIIDKYEKKLIRKIADSEFPYEESEDRNSICDIALKNACPDENEIMSIIYYNRRKGLIEESLIKYFSENDSMNLDGFVKFRLNEYKNELYELCENAADELKAEKEYENFLDMLKFFVSVQKPREKIVHIINKDGNLIIMNKRKRDITQNYQSEFICGGDELTNEDIILGALISIAPEKIIVHGSENDDRLFSTLKTIFSDVTFKE